MIPCVDPFDSDLPIEIIEGTDEGSIFDYKDGLRSESFCTNRCFLMTSGTRSYF